MFMSCHQKAGQNRSIIIAKKLFENVAQFKHLKSRPTLTRN
jgi:hypothetical protein